jgi:parvulin-like peptidyl-prolyl isomerase
MAAEKELAQIWSKRIPQLAPEADFETLAYEDYLANPQAYDKTTTINITQILLATEERTLEEAEELALELKTQLDDQPELFQKFVALYSDDESKVMTFGRLEDVSKGQMVEPFEKAAFALTKEGDISEPVITQYGVHLIRLDAINGAGVPPFEEVKDAAIEKQKLEHQQAYLRQYLSKLFTASPVVFPEGSVEIMAKRHFGENLEKAPVYTDEPAE